MTRLLMMKIKRINNKVLSTMAVAGIHLANLAQTLTLKNLLMKRMVTLKVVVEATEKAMTLNQEEIKTVEKKKDKVFLSKCSLQYQEIREMTPPTLMDVSSLNFLQRRKK